MRENLARTVLDDDVAILTNRTSLLGVSLGSTGIGLGLKLVLLVRHPLSFSLFLTECEVLTGKEEEDEIERAEKRRGR